jgi:beta-glucosidase
VRLSAPGSEVGIVLNLTPVLPASPAPADRDAARRLDGTFNRWFLDPLFGRQYPADVIGDRVRRGELAAPALPFVEAGDMDEIAAPLDFLGVNYYSRVVVRAGTGGEPVHVPMAPRKELTDMGWEVFPEGLTSLLLHLDEEYRPRRIYITENGVAYSDAPDSSGRIADVRRVAFHQAHLIAVHRAIAAGVPLHGYFAWSLLDNFEWASGYSLRFGIVHVDFASQRRTMKSSGIYYREVIRSRGAILSEPLPASTVTA